LLQSAVWSDTMMQCDRQCLSMYFGTAILKETKWYTEFIGICCSDYRSIMKHWMRRIYGTDLEGKS